MTDPDRPASGARPSPAPASINEATILDKWRRHIARVAGAVARGSHVDSGDLAQEARLRVLTVIRAYPEAPDQYIATVIVNATGAELTSLESTALTSNVAVPYASAAAV